MSEPVTDREFVEQLVEPLRGMPEEDPMCAVCGLKRGEFLLIAPWGETADICAPGGCWDQLRDQWAEAVAEGWTAAGPPPSN